MPLGNVAKVAIGWTIGVTLGVSGFAYSRVLVERSRYESMKVRERMRKSNEGEYQLAEERKFEL